MKSFFLCLAMLIAVEFSYAQNTFPTSGNVGIGTNTPSAPLDIQSSNANGLRFGRSGTDIGQIDFSNNDLDISSNTNNMRFSVQTGQVFSFSTGNVGIGTTNPSAAKLVLNSGTTNQNSLINGDKIGFTRTSDAAEVVYLKKSTDLGSEGTANIHGYDGLIFRTTGAETPRMTILSTGKVGIGTLTPDELLSVNGTIHTKEVKVDLSGWSDYVFKPTYTLPSLSQVKSYIDQNHHLSEMPSEQDVVKNGLNLGEIVKLQTKKIEELTLYLIEKDKQVSDQQKEIEQLKEEQKKTAQQETRIATLEKALLKLPETGKQ